ESHTDTAGESAGWSLTVSHKTVPLPVVVRELQETGQLRTALTTQEAQHRQHLHGLGQRRFVVISPGMKKGVEVEAAEVKDPFASPEAQERGVENVRRLIAEAHDYYYQPSFDGSDQDRRLRAFLGGKDRKPESVAAEDGEGDAP